MQASQGLTQPLYRVNGERVNGRGCRSRGGTIQEERDRMGDGQAGQQAVKPTVGCGGMHGAKGKDHIPS